jgi:hypothetical protein
MQQRSIDHVDDAEESRPDPLVTAQIAGDVIALAEQEVGRPDEERECEEPGGDGEPLCEVAP